MDLAEDAARLEPSSKDTPVVVAFIQSKEAKRPASEVRQRALAWFTDCLSIALPADARFGKDVKIKDGNRLFLSTSSAAEDQDIWACRLSDPIETGAQSRLIMESVVCSAGGRVTRLGFRLLADTPDGESPLLSSEQRLAAPLASLCDLYCTVAESSPQCRIVRSQKQADDLVSDLLDPRRNRPIIVLSTRGRAERASATTLDSADLAKAVNGLAQVCVVTARQTFQLMHGIGKRLAVFDGAVRMYLPGLKKDSEPARHRLHRMEGRPSVERAERIRFALQQLAAEESSSRYRAQGGEWSYAHEAVRKQAAALESPPVWLSGEDSRAEDPPASAGKEPESAQPLRQTTLSRLTARLSVVLESAGALFGRRGLRAGTEIDEIRGRLEVANRELEESAALRKRLEGKLEEARRKFRKLEKSHRSAKKKLWRATEKLRELEGELAALRPLPQSWERIVAWCDADLRGKAMLAQAVRKALPHAQFENVETAARGLRWLANEYRDCRMNGRGDDLRGPIPGLGGVRNERCGADSFPFDWQGRRRTVEWHLRKGNSRDPRHCLRIYYFWDAALKQVVVASMPAHRSSSSS